MRKTTLTTALAVCCAGALAACGAGTTGGEASGSTSLNIYAWAGEVPDSVVEAFEEETGIAVTLDTFDSNETMISKLAAGNAGYDIVEPSQYAVQQLIAQELIAPLDHDAISGLDNLQAKFVDPTYDPGNAYAVPWIWGTTGLLYNETCTGEPLTSWTAMFDEKYAGKIYMLDNMLASYIVGLQVNGLSATTTDEDEIETATQTLIGQKPLLAGYNSTNYYDLVASGDACMSLAWGGSSVAKVIDANPDVHYVLPEEGGTIWVDSFAVVKDAPHADAALAWLNFVLRPEIGAMAVDDGSLATTNEAALDLITDTDLLENSAVFAPAEQTESSEFIVDPGEALAYFQDGWTRVKAS